ncbi:MAG: hypothetical protein ABSH48_12015 [Verrucomicrobiota bacterium]
MLDYLRRKAWIFLFGAVLELALGWFGGCVGGKTHDLWMFQFQIGIFMGVLLLSFDLQRGLARAVAALPLTAGQIGRAWWLVSVAIPSVAFSALLWAGAGLFRLFHPAASVDAANLVLAGAFLFTLMGSTLTLVFVMSHGPYAAGWRRFLRGALGAVLGVAVGGGFLFINSASQNYTRLACFLAVGLGFTVAGWFLAGRFVTSRASFRLGTQSLSLKTGAMRGPVRQPDGYGGIPLLITTTIVRSFLVGMAMIVIMPVVFMMQGGGATAWWEVFKFFPAMGIFSFWFVIIFSVAPTLMQLRFLRTLPISATSLAAALIAILILPLLALQAVTAGIAGLSSGAPAAFAIADNFLLTLPAVALSVVLFALLGMGLPTYVLMFGVMTISQVGLAWWQAGLHRSEAPSGLCAVASGLLFLLGFWLMRRLLLRSSDLYLVKPDDFDNLASGGGR